MDHKDFEIGECFFTATGKWICTDVGSKTIVAVKYEDYIDNFRWELQCDQIVFDSLDFGGCGKTQNFLEQ